MAQTVTEKTRFSGVRIFLFDKMCALARRGYLRFLPDKLFLKLQFYLKLGRFPNLRSPRLYNDKLQWIKLYDRDPRYRIFVDKLAVRDYVAETVGDRYLIPEVARYERVDAIEWANLPDRFALKCTHGSGCNTICPDKKKLDIAAETRKLEGWMKRDWFDLSREWPYRGVKPRILVEEFLEGIGGQSPFDYKILCFSGEPRYIIVDVDRFTDHKRNFYDVDWVRQDVFNRHPGYDGEVPRPENLAEMLAVAGALSNGLAHIRIDLYNVKGKIYFGEMTFFHGYGMEVFRPRAFEAHLGDLIRLGDKPS